jgi:hypothetical protein
MRKLALLAVVCLGACLVKKPPPPAPAPAPKPVVRVDGVDVAQSDIAAIATEKSVAPDSPEALDAAIDLYVLRSYAKKHDIAAADATTFGDEAAQLETRIMDSAPPPPPGVEPMLTVDHAYLFLDKVPKAQRKKAKASADAFRKIAADDPAKTFMSIFDELKLDGAYWHVADDENYVASKFTWVPPELAEGQASKPNVRPDAVEIIRLKKRYDAQYPDNHAWLMGYLKSSTTVER